MRRCVTSSAALMTGQPLNEPGHGPLPVCGATEAPGPGGGRADADGGPRLRGTKKNKIVLHMFREPDIRAEKLKLQELHQSESRDNRDILLPW